MTEEEAKAKWCPFARFSGADAAGSFNRGSVDPMNRIDLGKEYIPRCIGSACMAWRKRDEAAEVKLPQGQEPPSADWYPYGTIGQAEGPPLNCFRITFVGGYCGLAGAPR